ncbi:glycosyltransferase family 39 protein [Candidatus Daviesbacteria bacterium]|nr:glycosyltransferase family 39 protein [Candidatus Daviesbacteria bacterium]
MKFFKLEFFLLILIVLLGFYLRLYKIDNPIADWHSWRQADTAAVARNFFKEGFNPFLPKYDDMSGVAEKPYPNPNRFRFVEFPIYPSLIYLGYLINGGVDEKIARFVSILFSLGSIVFLYLITKRYLDKFSAYLAAILFAITPFVVFFSRAILPESSLLFFCLGMVYFTDRWIYEDKRNLLLLSIFFTSAAFLTKPMAIFYLIPLFFLIYKKEGKLNFNPTRYLVWIIPSLLPLLAWRLWISQHPEGIPASNWLLNGADSSGKTIRFRPAFWRWIISDRLSREILSPIGLGVFLLGILTKSSLRNTFLYILATFSFLYLIIFARGNVQHDYYQYLITPALIIFSAKGFGLLFKGAPFLIPRLISIPIGLSLFFLMIYLSWVEVKGLYQINNPVIVETGKFADKILPKEAIVVAPYNGDSAFLYQVNRPGWPNLSFPIEDLIKNYGVTHYISTTRDENTVKIMQKYKVLEDNPKFVIVDVRYEDLK